MCLQIVAIPHMAKIFVLINHSWLCPAAVSHSRSSNVIRLSNSKADLSVAYFWQFRKVSESQNFYTLSKIPNYTQHNWNVGIVCLENCNSLTFLCLPSNLVLQNMVLTSACLRIAETQVHTDQVITVTLKKNFSRWNGKSKTLKKRIFFGSY